MVIRYLGSAIAALGLAGGLFAQSPNAPFSYLNGDRPAARISGVRSINTPVAGQSLIRVSATESDGQVLPKSASPATPAAMAATSTPASNTLTQGCSVNSASTSCPNYACDPCGPCGPCGPAGKYWVAAEWLYWKTSGNPVPALVTTSPLGTPRTNAGVLGDPSTSILYGNTSLNNDWRNGFRIRSGMWFDDCQTLGIESDFFFLGRSRNQASFSSDSTGSPILMRPFYNAVTNAQDTELVSYPGVLRGSVSVDSKSSFWGGSTNLIKNISCDPCGRTDFLMGYTYMNLTDDLTIREDLTSLPGATNVPVGTRFQIEDRFRTVNNIHVPYIGLNWERRFSYFYANVRSTIGLGWNHSVTEISGSTTITPPPPGVAQVYPGGLLTQPTNIGRYTSNHFVVVPSGQIRLGCQLTEHARAYVGYDFLYVSSVVRAGDQIDTRVNTNQIAPSQGLGNSLPVPSPTGRRTDFWAHGVTLGLEFRF
ncbi:MAG: BBP7 family outer membrane beta-barrel protein [Gemmataceae bacterium]